MRFYINCLIANGSNITMTTSISNSGIVFFSSLCASTFGLGCWQILRYNEKLGLIDKRTHELSLPPLTCGNSDSGFRRVLLQGYYKHECEMLVGPRGPPTNLENTKIGGFSMNPQGYSIITPLELNNENRDIVLVQRGWVSMTQKNINNWERPSCVVNVKAVLGRMEQPKYITPTHNPKTPRQLTWLDRKTIEQKMNLVGKSLLFYTQIQDNTETANIYPLRPDQYFVGQFKVLPGVHLGYAVTWFGLSLAGMIMTRKMVVRRN